MSLESGGLESLACPFMAGHVLRAASSRLLASCVWGVAWSLVTAFPPIFVTGERSWKLWKCGCGIISWISILVLIGKEICVEEHIL